MLKTTVQRMTLAALAVCVLSGGITANAGHLNFTFEKVVDYNTSVPDGTGTFSSFYEPGIDANGDIAFEGRDGDNTKGIYAFLDGTLVEIADTNDFLPGSDDYYESFDDHVEIRNGNVLFYGRLGDNEYDALVLANETTSRVVVQESVTQVPGEPEGIHFDGLNNSEGFGYDGDVVAFTCSYYSGPDWVYSLFLDDDGVLTRLVKPGDPAPDGGTFISSMDDAMPDANGTGVFFRSSTDLEGPGLFVIDTGVITEIVNETMAIPEGTGNFTGYNGEAMIDAGKVVFEGLGSDDQSGVYLFNGTDLLKIVDTSTVLPRGNTFNSVYGDVSLSNGTVAFLANTNAGKELIVWSNGALHSPIAVGDVLDDRLISGLSIFRRHCMVGNHIGLRISFDDGSRAIYRITFTPDSSGAGMFIKTVTVTHPGNAGDDPHGGYGSVEYVYDIGQFEINTGRYVVFLNAVAADDTYGLYNTDMWDSEFGCKIQRSGFPGSYSYSVDSDWRDLPVNFVSWGDAARFCNWLHNGQPFGAQDLSTTEDGSYFLDGATTDAELIAVTRKPDATWVIPSEDEWYKAAYHNNDGITATYWDYPIGTDNAPTPEIPSGTDMLNGSANFWGTDFVVGAPYYRTDVGSYTSKPSTSPYGTYDQGGNVFEWNEGILFDTARGMRGGAYYSSSDDLRSWNRGSFSPTTEHRGFGFRVARTRNDAEPCFASPELLGQYDSTGQATNMAIGDYFRLYIADGTAGLKIVNVFDPSAPNLMGSYSMDDAFDVVYDDFITYVTDQNFGLRIIHAGSPTNPQLLGSYDAGGSAFGLSVQGTTAYMATFGHGLQIVDVSDSANPTYLGSYDANGYAIDVAVEGSIAYLASLSAGLQIFDVSDPANITLLGVFDTFVDTVSVVVKDGVAYLADGEGGLHAIDVSDPTAPFFLASFDTEGLATDVVVEGNTAYVADADAGVQLINVSDPASPSLRGWYSTPGSAGSVLLNESTMYIAGGEDGLHMVDAGHLSITPLGVYESPGFALDVTVMGTTAYLGDGQEGLKTLDVSDPENPVLLGSYPTIDYAGKTAIAGTTAYLIDEEEGLLILDVSDAADPQYLGMYSSIYGTNDVVVSGSIAYVIESSWMRTLDVSDPANPTQIGVLYFDSPSVNLRAMTLANNTLYLAGGADGLLICDVSNPASPVLLGSDETPDDAIDVAVVGTVAYVLDRATGLLIFDVSDPSAPELLGQFDILTNSTSLTVKGSWVYLVTAIDMAVINVSDPTSPYQMDTYANDQLSTGVYVLDTTVYLTDQDEGLQIIEVDNPCRTLCKADLNHDDKGDLTDYAIFSQCMHGPNRSVPNGCATADIDADGDVDLADFATFQAAFGCQ